MYKLHLSKRKSMRRKLHNPKTLRLSKDQQKYEIVKPKNEKVAYYYPEVYKQLIAIDYCQDVTNPHSMFQLDRGFTPLDWLFAELIE